MKSFSWKLFFSNIYIQLLHRFINFPFAILPRKEREQLIKKNITNWKLMVYGLLILTAFFFLQTFYTKITHPDKKSLLLVSKTRSYNCSFNFTKWPDTYALTTRVIFIIAFRQTFVRFLSVSRAHSNVYTLHVFAFVMYICLFVYIYTNNIYICVRVCVSQCVRANVCKLGKVWEDLSVRNPPRKFLSQSKDFSLDTAITGRYT